LYLLGGYGGVVEKLSLRVIAQGKKVQSRNERFDVRWYSGSQNVEADDKDVHRQTILKINKFKPDILLVSYGPIKQEKWIAQYKDQLNVKVAIGVGGAFDELVGRVARSPGWMGDRGLKWLWRLLMEPKRFKRIWAAVAAFPWLIWRSELSNQ
jgi:N-acetylglucosaminyldiphosphoundecaprenol N-acetyl-beta-D-mannosaminyltransferase